jgi:hypothetical protein
MRSHEYRDRARSPAAMPYAASSTGSARSSRIRLASSDGRPGGTSRPVIPSATMSGWPPTAAATTGVPHAIASTATMADCSWQETLTSKSAERSRAGIALRFGQPANMTRSEMPRALASQARLRCASGRRSCACGGHPATTSSASGTPARASSKVSSSLRSASVVTASSRARLPRVAAGPSGANSSVSTPHGTTLIEFRGTPRQARSCISAELGTTTALAVRAIADSSRIRAAGASSFADWLRRSLTPREWNVCTTGMPRPRAPASAARPPVQRTA